MKDAFNEDLPYITHFIVLDPFLRRPRILLTFTGYLTLIISKLSKTNQPFLLSRIQINQSFSAYSKLLYVFLLYVDSIIFHCNNIEHFFACGYCCKLFVIKDFLLASSGVYSVFCVVPYADVTFIEYFPTYGVTKQRMKSRTGFFITPNIFLHLYFIFEFTYIVFVLFF